jgi:hypothetical protein
LVALSGRPRRRCGILGNDAAQRAVVEIAPIDRDLLEAAWGIFKKYADHSLANADTYILNDYFRKKSIP